MVKKNLNVNRDVNVVVSQVYYVLSYRKVKIRINAWFGNRAYVRIKWINFLYLCLYIKMT